MTDMISFDEEKQEKELGEIRQKEEEELIQSLAHKHQIPYIDLVLLPIENDALRLLPEAQARAAKAAVFGITGKKANVAVLSPKTEAVEAALSALAQGGYAPTLFMASMRSLEKAWKHYAEISSGKE